MIVIEILLGIAAAWSLVIYLWELFDPNGGEAWLHWSMLHTILALGFLGLLLK